MPFYAIEEVSRKTNTGTGAQAKYADGNGVKNLQTWTMIDHDDLNTVSAVEFDRFLDGSQVPTKNWDSSEPAAGKHFVYETSAGKWKTTDENTQFTCTTCEMGLGE
jgi:hypothetical protein